MDVMQARQNCGQLAEYEVYYPEKMMNHMYDRIAGGYLALEVLG